MAGSSLSQHQRSHPGRTGLALLTHVIMGFKLVTGSFSHYIIGLIQIEQGWLFSPTTSQVSSRKNRTGSSSHNISEVSSR
jgi:hypothetical protein